MKRCDMKKWYGYFLIYCNTFVTNYAFLSIYDKENIRLMAAWLLVNIYVSVVCGVGWWCLRLNGFIVLVIFRYNYITFWQTSTSYILVISDFDFIIFIKCSAVLTYSSHLFMFGMSVLISRSWCNLCRLCNRVGDASFPGIPEIPGLKIHLSNK